MFKIIRKRLIDNLNEAHRMLSVWAASSLFFVASLYEYLPEAKQYVPDGWMKYGFLAVLLARLYKQKSVTK